MLSSEIDRLWQENNGFHQKTDAWLELFKKAKLVIRDAKRKFRQVRNLRAYVSLVGAPRASFSLRCGGQEVAELLISKGRPFLRIDDGQTIINGKYFNFYKKIVGKNDHGGKLWADNECVAFRKHFMGLDVAEIKLHSPEHYVESLLIQEMMKKDRSKFGGKWAGIQPVTIAGIPLQIPLPISASAGQPMVKGNGHIDILAKRRSGRSAFLSLWELKAPGAYNGALRESYIYTYTLLKLLRDKDKGSQWYQVFGMGLMPPKLTIETVICVHRDKRQSLINEFQRSAADMPPMIGEDKIKLSVAFYVIEGNSLTVDKPVSIEGL